METAVARLFARVPVWDAGHRCINVGDNLHRALETVHINVLENAMRGTDRPLISFGIGHQDTQAISAG